MKITVRSAQFYNIFKSGKTRRNALTIQFMHKKKKVESEEGGLDPNYD
jgi:hypothetical protein